MDQPREDTERQRAAAATLRASRALVGVSARSLAPILDQISLPQFRVLVILAERGPTRSGLIAEQLGVHPSTFTRMADRLVAAGWVERQEGQGSRREVHIGLAGPGRDLVESVSLRRLQAIEDILAPLTPAQCKTILDGLQEFAEAAGEPGLADLAVLGF